MLDSYTRGVEQLLKRLDKEQAEYLDAVTLQSQLNENISAERLYGPTENTRAARARLIRELNRLALSALGASFAELCRSREPDASARTPPAAAPATYRYLGPQAETGAEQYARARDGQVAVLLAGAPGLPGPHLFDRTAITARQFSDFLNDLLDRGEARVARRPTDNVKACLDARNRPLAFDALDCWQRGPGAQQPWLYAAAPWGMSLSNGRWQPTPGADLLPATHVTWLGACLYGLWAHGQWLAADTAAPLYLPTADAWRAAASWDPSAESWRRYPWGDIWERERVNYAGFWAGYEVGTQMDWQQSWAQLPSVYRLTRPLPVDSLEIGGSAAGCIQLLGNVWEWCADLAPGRVGVSRVIKGGACFSPREYCRPDWSSSWPENQADAYLGFRCCCPLTQ